METHDTQNKENKTSDFVSRHRTGRVMGGMVIVTVGVLLAARELGADIPQWLFTWPMLLIVLGLFVGAKHSFRGVGWLIMMGVGTIILVNEMAFDLPLKQLMWPVLVICIGIAMIVRPRRWEHAPWGRHGRGRDRWDRWKEWEHNFTHNAQQSSDNFLDVTTVFGGTKKNIITKEFKGGDLTTFFGGTELNFMQADLTEKAVMDITQVFGGTKLVVPPHWTIRTEEMVTVFGSIEDKRPIRSDIPQDGTKILVLKGTCLFGGIDIKSY